MNDSNNLPPSWGGNDDKIPEAWKKSQQSNVSSLPEKKQEEPTDTPSTGTTTFSIPIDQEAPFQSMIPETDSASVASSAPAKTKMAYTPLKRKYKANIIVLVFLLIVSLGGVVFLGYHHFFGEMPQSEKSPTLISAESLPPSPEPLKSEESPTESPQLPIAEPIDESWKLAYLEIIYEWEEAHNDEDYNPSYGLFYIDDDDIPELHMFGHWGATKELYTYHNGEVILLSSTGTGREYILSGYIEREGIAWDYIWVGGGANYGIHQLEDGNYTAVEHFTSYLHSVTATLVSDTEVRVRNAPPSFENSSIIAVLTGEITVTVIGQTMDSDILWYQITYFENGMEMVGFVCADHIDLNGEFVPNEYTINDVAVSEDEWQRRLNEYLDKGIVPYDVESYSYKEIVSFLGGNP